MRALAISTNFVVSSAYNSECFKLRDNRFSARIRRIASRERAADATQLHVLVEFTSWLDWMPSSICATNLTSGLDRPLQNSEQNSCPLSFQTGTDFAIVLWGRLRQNEFSWRKIIFITNRTPPTSY
jgi:hypothetical protein